MRFAAKIKGALVNLFLRVGRRGSYLIFLALLDILYGYSIVTKAGPLFRQVNIFLPDKVWGIIWISAGVIIFAQAFARLDRIGYVLATVLKFVWGSIQIFAFITQPNDPRGWVAAVLWYAFAILTAIVANWPEHKVVRIEDFNGR